MHCDIHLRTICNGVARTLAVLHGLGPECEKAILWRSASEWTGIANYYRSETAAQRTVIDWSPSSMHNGLTNEQSKIILCATDIIDVEKV